MQGALRSGLSSAIRWIKPASIHLTLKFLGETPDSKIFDIVNSIEAASKEMLSFSLDCSGVGVFPTIRQPKVVWIGLKLQPELLKLQKEIDNSLIEFGYEQEKREFSPHLSLGRVNSYLKAEEKVFLTGKMKEYLGSKVTSFSVEEIQLIRSDIKPSGPIYTIQNQFILQARK